MQASLLVQKGKLERRSVDAAFTDDTIKSSRLFINDKTSKLRFLVDTGADISVIPPKQADKKNVSNLVLYAANNATIQTYDSKTIFLDLGLRRNFTWKFVVADVSHPILGADFLKYYGIVVDIKNNKLIDSLTNLNVNCSIANIPSTQLTTIDKKSPMFELLSEFKEITQTSNMCKYIKHNITHPIITNGPPVVCKPRRLNPTKLAAAKKEFELMVQQGICRPSSSKWANPLHMRLRANGEWRVCGDYRALNNITEPDRYPIAHIHDITQACTGMEWFSTIDFKRAYHQVPVAPEDIEKTAIITPFGLFEFLFMTLGLRNSGQTFQRFMHMVLRGLPFVIIYLDDILIFSKTIAEHYEHMRVIFERLKQYGLVINLEKCVFAAKEVKFLGHLINSHGVRPLPDKVSAIKNFPKPQTQKQMRRFLSTLNFYRRFIPNAVQAQQKLQVYLKGNKKSDEKIEWNETTSKAFEDCKESLSETALLAHINPNSTIALFVDASDTAIGGVVQQANKAGWQPLSFFSQTLDPAQRKYSTYDRELFAIYKSIRHFRFLLEGTVFTTFTDHKPLTFAFKQKPDKASPRQERQLNFISQFTTDIRHVSGKDNVVADMLSRIEALGIPKPVEFDEIYHAQESDKELAELLKDNTSLKLKKILFPHSANAIYCDISTENARPYIPTQLRKRIFDQLHNVSHPGIRATRKLITRSYVWPSIQKDCNKLAKACLGCQKSKVQRHIKTPRQDFLPPNERFEHVHIDIVGPLPPSEGKRYVLTMIDRFSRWLEAIPIETQTADEIAKTFHSNWVCRFGVPVRISTDRGRQFESELFNQLTNMYGSQRIRTTAYNPKANGMVERVHRTMKSALMAHNTNKWSEVLPTILLGLRTALRKDSECSAAELVYGSTIRLPGQFFKESQSKSNEKDFLAQLRQTIQDFKSIPPAHHDKPVVYVDKQIQNCTHVFIRKDAVRLSLEPPYEGPYQIIKRNNDKVYTIRVKNKNETVSVDRLKPAYIINEEIADELPTPALVITTSGHRVRFMEQPKPKSSS